MNYIRSFLRLQVPLAVFYNALPEKLLRRFVADRVRETSMGLDSIHSYIERISTAPPKTSPPKPLPFHIEEPLEQLANQSMIANLPKIRRGLFCPSLTVAFDGKELAHCNYYNIREVLCLTVMNICSKQETLLKKDTLVWFERNVRHRRRDSSE